MNTPDLLMTAASDDGPATNTLSVVDALNRVYMPALTAFEQFHRQEHRFEIKYRYKKLVKRYDKLVHCARGWRRCLLNRIERLGGEALSTLEPVVVRDEVRLAYMETETILRRIYDAISVAIDSAKMVNDHPTHKILLRLQHEVDLKVCKVQAWLRQVQDLKENYLVTVV